MFTHGVGLATPDNIAMLCMGMPILHYNFVTWTGVKWSVLPQKLHAPLLPDPPFTPRAAAPAFLGLAPACWLMASLIWSPILLPKLAIAAAIMASIFTIEGSPELVLVVAATGGFGACGGGGGGTCTTPMDADPINTYLTTS